MKATETINLKNGHPDYTLRGNVGPVILYHGAVLDLRRCRPKDAEALASDPDVRYLTYSDARLRREMSPRTRPVEKEK